MTFATLASRLPRSARAPSLAAALFASALSACEDLSAPKDPVWNKQPCDHCHMVVSDPRYAAQLTTRDGKRLYYDDIGCLAERINKSSADIAHAWVREGSGTWRDAYQARYARGDKTPMDYGFVPSDKGPLDFKALLREVADKRAKGAP